MAADGPDDFYHGLLALVYGHQRARESLDVCLDLIPHSAVVGEGCFFGLLVLCQGWGVVETHVNDLRIAR